LPSRVELSGTPFFPQADQECGPAALATVLGAAGVDATPAELADTIYLPGRQGTLQPEIAAAARARGRLPYELSSSLDAVRAELAAGRPVLVLQKLGVGPWPGWHYAVVVGYDRDNDEILLRSGTQERAVASERLFDTTWARAGRWGIVLLRPGDLPATPDLDRYMSAAASLEAVGRTDDARAAYLAAAQHWPEAALPHLGLANIAAARNDWPAAEQGFRAAARLEPGNASALNNHAEALLRMGCPQAARREIERAGEAAGNGPLAGTVAATRAGILAAMAEDGPGCPSGR
jgi:tetratricopeptide (TPR) repeat protein